MKREDIIRKLIKESGMNMKSFAESIDMPYTTLYTMLNKGIGKASVDNVLKICKGLGISVEELEALADGENNRMRKGDANIIVNNLEEEKELQLIQRAHKKMDAKQRKKMMDILKLTFEELFNEEEE